MKRMMAAVIVGPTVRSSVSVFASEREYWGPITQERPTTTEALKKTRVGLGHGARGNKAERGCFAVKASEENDAGLDVYVNPETGMPL